jgi:hypothetical protein
MIDARYREVTVRIAFGAPLVSEQSHEVSAVLAERMRELLANGRSDWLPLAQRSPDPATTAA